MNSNQFRIIFCMYIGYAAMILCKTSISALSPMLVEELHFTKLQIGTIFAYGSIGSLIGKLVMGFVADKYGGKFTITLAVLSVGLCTIIFGFSDAIMMFCVMYLILQIFRSAGWPAMAKSVEQYIPPNQYGKAWGMLSATSRASAVLSAFLFGGLLYIMTWQSVFFISGVIAILVALFIFNFFPKNLAPVKKREAKSEKIVPIKRKEDIFLNKNILETLKILFTNHRFILICGSMICTTMLMGFNDFMPLYLREVFKVSVENAAMASSAFPFGCFISVLIGGFIYDKLSKKQLIPALGGSLLVSFLCLFLLWIMPKLTFLTQYSFPIALITLALFGLSLAPVYYLPMSIFSVEFGGVRCGFIVALIDAFGYGGNVVYSIISGSLLDQNNGWEKFLIMMVFISVLAFIITVMFLYSEFKESIKNNQLVKP